MPWPEDSGGPFHPRPYRMVLCCLRCAFKPSASATSAISKLYQHFRGHGSPYGLQDALSTLHLFCSSWLSLQDSAIGARLDTGGWLPLTRQGLSPCKRRQVCLGADNAALQARGAAAAQRTLFPVACKRWFGCGYPVGCERGAPWVAHPRAPAPAYWTTSSAWIRSVGENVIPRAFAALRLSTNSNFMGCSTGRSAGLAPFKILSTYSAARRYSCRRSVP